MQNYNPPESQLVLEIRGTPIAKQSMRITRLKNGGFRKFTDKAVTDFASYVKLSAMEALEGRPPFAGPLELEVEFRFTYPKSLTKKARLLIDSYGKPYRDKRPDCDNLLKNFCDSLSGIAYQDDAQIVKITIEKVYHEFDGIKAVLRPVASK